MKRPGATLTSADLQLLPKFMNSETVHVIDEESIQLMVKTFYARVRQDKMLGPVFEQALHGEWAAHLPRMVEFWSTILLGAKKFHGNVYGKHMALNGIEPEHFSRWLGLLKQTGTEIYDQPAAAEIIGMAERVAGSLQLGFFGRRLV